MPAAGELLHHKTAPGTEIQRGPNSEAAFVAGEIADNADHLVGVFDFQHFGRIVAPGVCMVFRS